MHKRIMPVTTTTFDARQKLIKPSPFKTDVRTGAGVGGTLGDARQRIQLKKTNKMVEARKLNPVVLSRQGQKRLDSGDLLQSRQRTNFIKRQSITGGGAGFVQRQLELSLKKATPVMPAMRSQSGVAGARFGVARLGAARLGAAGEASARVGDMRLQLNKSKLAATQQIKSPQMVILSGQGRSSSSPRLAMDGADVSSGRSVVTLHGGSIQKRISGSGNQQMENIKKVINLITAPSPTAFSVNTAAPLRVIRRNRIDGPAVSRIANAAMSSRPIAAAVKRTSFVMEQDQPKPTLMSRLPAKLARRSAPPPPPVEQSSSDEIEEDEETPPPPRLSVKRTNYEGADSQPKRTLVSRLSAKVQPKRVPTPVLVEDNSEDEEPIHSRPVAVKRSNNRPTNNRPTSQTVLAQKRSLVSRLSARVVSTSNLSSSSVNNVDKDEDVESDEVEEEEEEESSHPLPIKRSSTQQVEPLQRNRTLLSRLSAKVNSTKQSTSVVRVQEDNNEEEDEENDDKNDHKVVSRLSSKHTPHFEREQLPKPSLNSRLSAKVVRKQPVAAPVPPRQVLDQDEEEEEEEDDNDVEVISTPATQRVSKKTSSPAQSSSTTSFTSPLQGFHLTVTNLVSSVTHEDVTELFGSVGALKKVTMRKRGSAEVWFVSETAAHKALKKYHTRELDGQPMSVVLDKSDAIPDKLVKPAPPSSKATPTEHQPLRFNTTFVKNQKEIEQSIVHRALFKSSLPDTVAQSRPVNFTVRM